MGTNKTKEDDILVVSVQKTSFNKAIVLMTDKKVLIERIALVILNMTGL